MMLHPLLSNLDDDYYYYTPHSYQENLRRAMALEDIRRRAELERYYRAQDARRLRNLQFGDNVYQTLLQRQALEREVERQDYHHALRFLRGEGDDGGLSYNPPLPDEHEDNPDVGPTYRLMRGSDGRIYRVPIQKRDGRVSSSRLQRHMNETPSTPEIRPTQEFSKVARDVTIGQGSTEPIPSMVTEECERIDWENNQSNELKPGIDREKIKMTTTTTGTQHNKRTKKVFTIVVEDASDNEEDNDLKSPWRNRRPSPGEWIEPVAIFDKIPR